MELLEFLYSSTTFIILADHVFVLHVALAVPSVRFRARTQIAAHIWHVNNRARCLMLHDPTGLARGRNYRATIAHWTDKGTGGRPLSLLIVHGANHRFRGPVIRTDQSEFARMIRFCIHIY